MPTPDLRPMFEQMSVAVKAHTARAVDPLREKLGAVESSIAALPTADFVRAEVAASTGKMAIDLLGALSKSDGQAISVEDVRPMVASMIEALPVPKDGADGRDGRDGASVDPSEVARLVDAAVEARAADADADVAALADAITQRFMKAAALG